MTGRVGAGDTVEMPGSLGQIAVYVDVDNIVMSRYDQLHGREAFRNDKAGSRSISPHVRHRLEEARVDFGAVMDYATTFGTVAIARAYANWARPVHESYATDLQQYAIDLVQLFPLTKTKNGADIRLAVDAVEDQYTYKHITHVLVVAGDSDYVALAQRTKRTGRHVVGVGVGESVGRFWRLACDEFRNYEDLPGISSTDLPATAAPVEPEPATASGWEDLLQKAIMLRRQKSEVDWLPISSVKGQMQRLDSTFNERAGGHRTFTKFLESLPSLVELKTEDGTAKVRLRDVGAPLVAVVLPTAADGGPTTVPHEVALIRQRLGVATRSVFGLTGEQATLAALRCLWQLADTTEEIRRIPTADILASLLTSGFSESCARPAVNLLNATGLPALERDTDLVMSTNEELRGLADDALLRFLRQWMFDRIRNLTLPDALSMADYVQAVYGSSLPEGVADALADTERWAPYEKMTAALQTQLLAAPVLWDVAEAATRIPAELPIHNVDDFGGAIALTLLELERDPATVPLSAAFIALHQAGVLDGPDGLLTNTRAGADADDVVDAVVTSWARFLISGGLLDPTGLVSRESFYRLVLPDRFQRGERSWIRDLLVKAA